MILNKHGFDESIDYKELFNLYMLESMKCDDLDKDLYFVTFYLLESNFNEKDLLFSNFFVSLCDDISTSLLLTKFFKDFDYNYSKMVKFFNDNFKEILWGDDKKYQKFTFAESLESFIKICDKIDSRFLKSLKNLDYFQIQNRFKEVKYFGRYSLFNFSQMLKISNLSKADLNTLFLSKGKDIWYVYSLSLVFGEFDKLPYKENKSKIFYNFNEDEKRAYDSYCLELCEKYPKLDFYRLETALCYFRKMFRNKNSRYVGHEYDLLFETIDTAVKKHNNLYGFIDLEILNKFFDLNSAFKQNLNYDRYLEPPEQKCFYKEHKKESSFKEF